MSNAIKLDRAVIKADQKMAACMSPVALIKARGETMVALGVNENVVCGLLRGVITGRFDSSLNIKAARLSLQKLVDMAALIDGARCLADVVNAWKAILIAA